MYYLYEAQYFNRWRNMCMYNREPKTCVPSCAMCLSILAWVKQQKKKEEMQEEWINPLFMSHDHHLPLTLNACLSLGHHVRCNDYHVECYNNDCVQYNIQGITMYTILACQLKSKACTKPTMVLSPTSDVWHFVWSWHHQLITCPSRIGLNHTAFKAYLSTLFCCWDRLFAFQMATNKATWSWVPKLLSLKCITH